MTAGGLYVRFSKALVLRAERQLSQFIRLNASYDYTSKMFTS